LKYDSGIAMVVGGNKAMLATSSGGSLHGTWSSEATVTTSDRRLKERIEPLDSVLGPRAGDLEGDSVAWALRELRPVAYRFRAGAEAKYTRFGFIADELERVLPELIRPLTERPDGPIGIVLPDLIALLVEQAKTQQQTMESLARRVTALERGLARLTTLEQSVAALRQEVRDLRAAR